jgi:probable rRNA maturation factor
MVNFKSEYRSFALKERLKHRKWLNKIAENHGFYISELNYLFVTDEKLLSINIEYLKHDTFTDIITFDLSSLEEKEIAGDILISIDRIKENADKYDVTFLDELRRVMAHGLLHLCGFGDKTKTEKTLMRRKEDDCLLIF